MSRAATGQIGDQLGGDLLTDSVVEIDRDAQQFGHAPGLSDATSRPIGRIAIKDFGNLPEAGIPQMASKITDHLPGPRDRLRVSVVDPQIGGDERPDQPSPDRPLVVSPVAALDAPGATPAILGIVVRE